MSNLKSIPKIRDSSNFRNSCLLKLKNFPETHCEYGKITIDSKTKKTIQEPKCSWWINSPENNYCFWKYIKENSDIDGSMRELIHPELATLLNVNSSKIPSILKEALKELEEVLNYFNKNELLEDLDLEQEISYDSKNHIDILED